MIAVLERSGFWGLVAMASWPNAAFDLCGICCGNFGMPFWTFFGATALGKGLIKAPLQCAFFSTLFSSADAVAAVAAAFPARWDVQRRLTETLQKAASGGLAGEQGKQGAALSPGGLLKMAIPAFMVYFLLSCIEQARPARDPARAATPPAPASLPAGNGDDGDVSPGNRQRLLLIGAEWRGPAARDSHVCAASLSLPQFAQARQAEKDKAGGGAEGDDAGVGASAGRRGATRDYDE